MISLLLLFACFAIGVFCSRLPFFHRIRAGRALLAGMMLVGLLCSIACTAAWLSAVSAMLPSIVTLVESIVSFALGLSGKTIAASTVTFIQGVASDIKGEITEVQSLIATYQSTPNATTLQKISAVFSAIVASLGTILSNVNITDAGTVSKITQLVGLAVAAVQAVIGLIPLVSTTMKKYADKSETADEVEHADAQAASLVAHHHRLLQDGYHTWKTTPSGEAQVDAVLATLPDKI